MLVKLFPVKASKIAKFCQDIATIINNISPLQFVIYTKHTSFISKKLYTKYLNHYGLDVVSLEPQFSEGGLLTTRVIGFKVTLKQTECVNPCDMGYCDDNGCVNRKRSYVQLPEVHEEFLDKMGVQSIEVRRD